VSRCVNRDYITIRRYYFPHISDNLSCNFLLFYFNRIVNGIETCLYNNSGTFEEYSDITTLRQRLLNLLRPPKTTSNNREIIDLSTITTDENNRIHEREINLSQESRFSNLINLHEYYQQELATVQSKQPQSAK
jgi:hypothetical protein